MKKTILLCLALMGILHVQAQFEIRPHVGANFTDVSNTPNGQSSRAKIGGQFGVSALIGNRLHIMPGIAYFTQNTEFTVAGEAGETNYDQRVNGVVIPLLVGYRFMDATTDPFVNFRVFAGPTMQFLTKTEFSGTVSDETVEWNNNRWTAMVGLGLDIKFVFLDFGYNWGLSRTGGPQGQLSNFEDFRNNNFFINLGVRLNLAN